jgi:alanine racemase
MECSDFGKDSNVRCEGRSCGHSYVHLECNLGVVRANYRVIAAYVAPAICAAVLKSDAYGIGQDVIGDCLFEEGCRDFFVAYVDEADELAKSLFNSHNVRPSYEIGQGKYNLFILDGPFVGDWCEYIAKNEYIPVLNTIENIIDWNNYAKSIEKLLPAILYVDTGLHRLGLPYKEFEKLNIANFEYIDWRLFMSHFVASGDVEHVANNIQLAKVEQIKKRFRDAKISLSDTAGILLGKDTHYDMVRIGMGLYGLANFLPGIKNSITMYGTILQIQDIEPGDSVGYDWTFTAKEKRRIATVAGGYADGVVHSPNTSMNHFIINGKMAPICGSVSMDLTTVDITNIGGVIVGDRAIILGVDKSEVNCISKYKLLTGLSKRVNKVFLY